MEQKTRQFLLARFWESALGFWRQQNAPRAWTLTLTLIGVAVLNLVLQYRINVWNRGMFDALGQRDGSVVVHQSMIFFLLIAGSVVVGAVATYLKMTIQRAWRRWMTAHVLDRWLTKGRHY